MFKQKGREQRMGIQLRRSPRDSFYDSGQKKKKTGVPPLAQRSALSLPILIYSKRITRWRVQCHSRSSLSPIRNPPWRLLCPPAHSQHVASNQGPGRCMPLSRRCRMLARQRQRQRALPSGGAAATVLARPRAACPRCASRWGPTGPSGSPAPPLRRGSTAGN